MLVGFFLHLKASGLPVSIQEFLTLLEGLQKQVCGYSMEDFYLWARTCLVKDESRYDSFDQAFGVYFNGLAGLPGLDAVLPEQWLRANLQKYLTQAEIEQLEKLGWEALLDTFRKRLEEQKERHEGGSKWIGTGGTSPFGNSGIHPEGIRIGGHSAGNRTAVKVWKKREFRNLDDSLELGTRNIKVALRYLRHFARKGAENELDLDGTIKATARNAGWLDLKMRPERHNTVKVLLFLDVGGSMDDHVKACEELFSACRSEFKHLEYYYFHNCVYERVWRDNRRRHAESIPVMDLLHKYGPDYKLIIVGDAAMSPYEILHQHGSVEHMNAEPGSVWLLRLLETWQAAVWLNPEPAAYWAYHRSTEILKRIMDGRMHPMTLDGLEQAMQALSHKH